MSACHGAGGLKKCFQAYLLQARVTNDCFVPLAQRGGLSQASLGLAGRGLSVSELTRTEIEPKKAKGRGGEKKKDDNIFMNI